MIFAAIIHCPLHLELNSRNLPYHMTSAYLPPPPALDVVQGSPPFTLPLGGAGILADGDGAVQFGPPVSGRRGRGRGRGRRRRSRARRIREIRRRQEGEEEFDGLQMGRIHSRYWTFY